MSRSSRLSCLVLSLLALSSSLFYGQEALASVLATLAVFALAACSQESQESDQAMSLNALVRLIEGELNDSDTVENYLRRLAACGYIEIGEYDTPEFVVAARHAYIVDKDFPRLIRSRIPDGIVRATYEIELEKISAFKCDMVKVTEN